jgi:hypothetical protein
LGQVRTHHDDTGYAIDVYLEPPGSLTSAEVLSLATIIIIIIINARDYVMNTTAGKTHDFVQQLYKHPRVLAVKLV